jgi:HSP20 family protein
LGWIKNSSNVKEWQTISLTNAIMTHGSWQNLPKIPGKPGFSRVVRRLSSSSRRTNLKNLKNKKIMTLVKVNNNGQKSLSSFVDEFFQGFPAGLGRDESFGFPPVNIHETADAYHLELSAPGRSKEDFKLSVEAGQLTVAFEKKEETKTEDYKTIRKEFSFKSFKRSFNLDDRINSDGIQAKYENGVLKLLLPKKEQVKESTKQISVQ